MDVNIENHEENHKIYKSEISQTTNILPGDRNGSPDESLNSTLVFIDAGFLEKLSKYFGEGKYLKFDRFLFANNLAKKEKLKCEKIFYYTAPPFQSDNPTKEEEKRKEGYDKFVKNLRKNGIIIREGRCQRLKIDGNYFYNQKAVDILMAIDLMKVLLEYPKVRKIILIASDSDFVPVVEELFEKGVKTILYTFYQKKRNAEFSRSNYLIKAVHKYKLLTKSDFNFPLI